MAAETENNSEQADANQSQSEDIELDAIKTVLGALKDLQPDARSNVIEYVFRRLGITAPAVLAAAQSQPANFQPAAPIDPHVRQAGHRPTDLRSLTDEKQPKTAIQMLAVVAYYLGHLAPANERRDYITAEDIKRYFPQAKFELPVRSDQTLVNAKNGGYFDVVATGQYRLNPVGQNLVTHKLPTEGKSLRRTRRARKGAAKTKKKAGR